MPQPIKIACLGEVMIELIADDGADAKLGVAGDTYNTAVYLTKLADAKQIEVSYITALGTDQFSQRILGEMKNHGIRTDHIEIRDGQMPGLYAISTDDKGERSFTYWREQAAARSLFQAPCKITPQSLLEFDLVYISGISMAILPPDTREMLFEALSEFRQAGGRLVFDSNYRPQLWQDVKTAQEVITQMWALCDVALPSVDDEMALFNDANEQAVMQRLEKNGVTFGALKRGESGPLAIGEIKNTMEFEKITNVVDTTAAGDSFNAGFLYQTAIGGSLDEAMQSGHALASNVIQASGAIIDLD